MVGLSSRPTRNIKTTNVSAGRGFYTNQISEQLVIRPNFLPQFVPAPQASEISYMLNRDGTKINGKH